MTNLFEHLMHTTGQSAELVQIMRFYQELNFVYQEGQKAMGITVYVSTPANSAHAPAFFASSWVSAAKVTY